MTGQESRPSVIVVGVDASAASVAALHWAMRRAATEHAVLKVVSVRRPPLIDPRAPLSELPHGLPDQDGPSLERLQVMIESERKGLPNPPEVIEVAVVGDPSAELALAAVDADLLVVGSHGRGPLAEVLGSVAADVLRHADCPVTVVNPHAAEAIAHPGHQSARSTKSLAR